MPPNLRREKLLLLYCVRTKKNTNNAANKAINTYIQETEKSKLTINNIIKRNPYMFLP